MIKREYNALLLAVLFYTTFPIPTHCISFSDEAQQRSTKYLPLIGLAIGLLNASLFYLFHSALSLHLSIILSIVITIIATGALHEDGFADFCDGFGGGYTKDAILKIMKDSAIGTYGAIGLLCILSIKILLIAELPVKVIPLAILCVHSMSRISPIILIYTSNYVSSAGKAVHLKQPLPVTHLLISLLFLIIPTLLLPWQHNLTALVVLLVTTTLFRGYVHKKIGGYTGDVLGALQQISEVVLYSSILISVIYIRPLFS